MSMKYIGILCSNLLLSRPLKKINVTTWFIYCGLYYMPSWQTCYFHVENIKVVCLKTRSDVVSASVALHWVAERGSLAAHLPACRYLTDSYMISSFNLFFVFNAKCHWTSFSSVMPTVCVCIMPQHLVFSCATILHDKDRKKIEAK